MVLGSNPSVPTPNRKEQTMLLIMVTVHASGAVSYVKELNAYTNLSHGSREVNKPEPVKVEAPTNEEIRTWISTNCEDELNANKKIQAIKKTRDAFYSEDPTGFRLGLRDAKDHVEAVIAEYEEKKRSSSYCDCD
jgi:ribosomal protein L7/L12